MDFYQEYDWDAGAEDGLVTADLDELPCGLLAVNVTLNGVAMPALLDTGTPQTIVNRAAAAAAGHRRRIGRAGYPTGRPRRRVRVSRRTPWRGDGRPSGKVRKRRWLTRA